MAKKGLFGRLAESVRNTISRLFGSKEPESVKVEPIHTPEPVQPVSPPVTPPITPSSTTSTPLADYSNTIEEEPDYSNDSEYYRQTSSAYREFENFKSQYEDLISDANRRWEAIESQGFSSMAIDRAKDETGRDYFSLDFADTEQDVIAEVTRARVFMADRTSTIEGAELYTAEINSERFRGKFGSEYRTPEYGNKGFDINVIDEEYAKEVFRSYRKLEEAKQGLIQEYGSENLIIAMYDAKVRGADPFMTGHHLIETWYKTKTDDWKRRFEEAQKEYERFNQEPHGTPFDYIGDDLDDLELDDMYF